MATHDPRIDAYIDRQATFAQPILVFFRQLVHDVCPNVEETMKWGMPTFVYNDGILCGMAAFKQHASFGFWKHAQVVGDDQPRTGMGSYGKLAALSDLPPKKQLIADIRKAMTLNTDAGKPREASRTVRTKPVLDTPADLAAALGKHARAKAAFEAFAPSHRRDYIEWITEAKRDETRQRRLLQAVEWIAEGKHRNWKYER